MNNWWIEFKSELTKFHQVAILRNSSLNHQINKIISSRKCDFGNKIHLKTEIYALLPINLLFTFYWGHLLSNMQNIFIFLHIYKLKLNYFACLLYNFYFYDSVLFINFKFVFQMNFLSSPKQKKKKWNFLI
jgi:hypothetical protein